MDTAFYLKPKYTVTWGVCRIFTLFFFSVALFSIPSSFAQAPDVQNDDIRIFWSETDNVFMFEPELVRHVFFGVITLQGNESIARRNLNRQVLDCRIPSQKTTNCWIDQLRFAKKNHRISSLFRTSINVRRIETKKYRLDKSKTLVTLYWDPPVIEPSKMSIKAFMNQVGAAEDSKYYRLKNELREIALNPVFQNKIEILVSNKRAKNLLDLYQIPPTDYNDSVTFKLDTTRLMETEDVAVFNIELKAIRIRVNHQSYRVNLDTTL